MGSSARVTFSFSGRLIIALIVVALAGALQTTNLIVIGAVKINLSLAALAAFGFIAPTFTWYLVLLLIAAFFVRFAPGLDVPLLAFLGVCLAGFAAGRFLAAVPVVGAPIIAFVATVFFYLIADPSFLQSSIVMVLIESVYNALVALGCYVATVALSHEQEIRISL